MEDRRANGEEQEELDPQREDGGRDQAEGEDDAASGNGGEVERAEPEEQAEQETTEDIDRAFD